MAILINIGQRGFILKGGLVAPGQQIVVDQQTAETLSKVYPKELKLVLQDKKVVEEILKPEVKEEKVEVKPEEKKATGRGRKKK